MARLLVAGVATSAFASMAMRSALRESWLAAVLLLVAMIVAGYFLVRELRKWL